MTDGSGPGVGAPRGAAGRKQLRRRILDLEPGPTSRGRPQKRHTARVQDQDLASCQRPDAHLDNATESRNITGNSVCDVVTALDSDE